MSTATGSRSARSNLERLGYSQASLVDLRAAYMLYNFTTAEETVRNADAWYNHQVFGDRHFRVVVVSEDPAPTPKGGSSRKTGVGGGGGGDRSMRELLVERYENGFPPPIYNTNNGQDMMVDLLVRMKRYMDVCGICVLRVEKRDAEYLRKLNDADELQLEHFPLNVHVETLDPSQCELYYVTHRQTGLHDYIYEPTGPDAEAQKRRYEFHVIRDPSVTPEEPIPLPAITPTHPMYTLMHSLPPLPYSMQRDSIFGVRERTQSGLDQHEDTVVLPVRCLAVFEQYLDLKESIMNVRHARAQLAHPRAVLEQRMLPAGDIATTSEQALTGAQSAVEASEFERRKYMEIGFHTALGLLPESLDTGDADSRNSAMARYRKVYDRPTIYDNPVKLSPDWKVVQAPVPSVQIDLAEERRLYMETVVQWKQIPVDLFLAGHDLVAPGSADGQASSSSSSSSSSKGRSGGGGSSFSASAMAVVTADQEANEHRLRQYRARASQLFARVYPYLWPNLDTILLSKLLLDLAREEYDMTSSTASSADTTSRAATQRDRRRRLALVLDPGLRRAQAKMDRDRRKRRDEARRRRQRERKKKGASDDEDAEEEKTEEDTTPVPTVSDLQTAIRVQLEVQKPLKGFLIFGREYDQYTKAEDLYEYERHSESEVKQRLDLLKSVGGQVKDGIIDIGSYVDALNGLTGLSFKPGMLGETMKATLSEQKARTALTAQQEKKLAETPPPAAPSSGGPAKSKPVKSVAASLPRKRRLVDTESDEGQELGDGDDMDFGVSHKRPRLDISAS